MERTISSSLKKNLNISLVDVFIITISGKTDMKEICIENCKSLLKIINKPILYYQLEFLERQGIKEVHIITKKEYAVKTQVILSQYQGTIKTNIIETHKEGLDLFNVIKNKLTKNNFMLIEGDSLLSFNLSEFIDSHFDNHNLLSLTLQKREPQLSTMNFLKKKAIDIFGIAKEDNRVIYYSQKESETDKEHHLFLPKNILKHCSQFQMLFNYIDLGVYLFNKSIFFILESEEFKEDKTKKNNKDVDNDEPVNNFNSIKEDFIPYLIKKSYSKKLNMVLINKKKNKFVYAQRVSVRAKIISNEHDKDIIGEYCYKIIDYPSLLSSIDEIRKPYDKILPIYFQTKNNDKNYFSYFMEGIQNNAENHKMFNFGIPELEGISMDSYIADKIGTIEKGSTIKQTIAGPNIQIKEGGKLSSCLIGLNVIIGKECKLTNCIIGDNVLIGDKCIISDCVIEDNYQVKNETNASKKILSKLNEDDIEF